MIFGQIKMIMTILLLVGVSGAVIYVVKLRADNAILKANQVKLEAAVETQKEALEQQKKDFEAIMVANKKLTELTNNLKKDVADLDKRFTKSGRDIGKSAKEKPKLIQRIVNKASAAALRCVEIAGGSPLTEEEKNATKKSEINRECPSIANPNYVPY
tara:strand:+ start:944 stop:1417 length:474 start_codon:yes stop_codon:yes gene_type:complete